MRLSFTGLQVDWTIKASAPRTGSSELKRDFPVGKGGDPAVAELLAQPVANGLGKGDVGVAGEHLYLFTV